MARSRRGGQQTAAFWAVALVVAMLASLMMLRIVGDRLAASAIQRLAVPAVAAVTSKRTDALPVLNPADGLPGGWLEP